MRMKANFNGAWEDETAEDTCKEGLARLKEYRENVPQYAYRLIRRREPK